MLQVLETEPGNVKALYRRAQGHLAQQDFVEAELDIRAALLVSRPLKMLSQCVRHLTITALDPVPDRHSRLLCTVTAV